MSKAPTFAAVKAQLAETAPTMTIRKTSDSEYRVTFRIDAIRAAFPEITAAAKLSEKAESLAAYESDLVDAYETAKAMYRVGLVSDVQPATAQPSETDSGIRMDEKTGRRYIDMTPTWSAMLSTFRMLVENGDATGRATAWQEIGRMAALADERNEMAKTLAAAEKAEDESLISRAAHIVRLESLAACANESLHLLPSGMARDEMRAHLKAAGYRVA